MAENDTINTMKDLIEATPEEVAKLEKQQEEQAARLREEERPLTKSQRKAQRDEENEKKALAAWVPKTALGKAVKAGKEKDFDELLTSHKKILESEIVDLLLRLENDLLLIGQAKGKFGGGKRRAWRQTQKKTMEGNVVTFSSLAVVGDRKGHVGIGMGRAKETLPSRTKALRQAKLSIIKVERGYESPEEKALKVEPHTVPFIVQGKCGSIRIKLIPAPRGTGLVVGDECKKILRLAGIADVYAVTRGQTRTTFNVAKACIDALKKTKEMQL
ncbi:MAG: 30S ribosomal protein S5 [Nanoarchaeota archaeon]